jgi:hypothetical protein
MNKSTLNVIYAGSNGWCVLQSSDGSCIVGTVISGHGPTVGDQVVGHADSNSAQDFVYPGDGAELRVQVEYIGQSAHQALRLAQSL